jgi:hypothetical protein
VVRRAVAASLVAVFAACTGGGTSGGATTTTRPATTTTDAPVPNVVLRVGLCFDANAPAAGVALTRTALHPADCAVPHRYELFATLVHPSANGAAYPGPTALFGYTNDQCLAHFESYVGTAYEQSALDLVPVTPDKLAWAAGDRELACAAFRTDFDLLTGSVAHLHL